MSSWQSHSLRIVALVGLAAGLVVAPREDAAGSAPFHLRLVRSEPAANDTVPPPAAIRLWFSLDPAMSVTSIRLKGAREVTLGRATWSGTSKAPVEAAVGDTLAPGRYTVTWKTASKDMHPVTGSYSFTVR